MTTPTPNLNLVGNKPAYSPNETTVQPEFIFQDGKKYKVEIKTIHHEITWQVWQGIKALVLTIFSLGIGLFFQRLRDKWEEVFSGDEKTPLYTRYPPKDISTAKTSRLGTALHPIKELPLEVRHFIDETRKDMTKLTISDLEKGLDKALKVASDIQNSEDKTTLFIVAERIARSYLLANKGEKAFEVRIEVAQKINPGPPLAELHISLQKEHPKLGLKLYPVNASLFKNHTLAVNKQNFINGKTQLHFYAKLSHPARSHLEDTLKCIKSNPDALYHALPKGFCKKINLYTEQISYKGRTKGEKKWEGPFSHDIENDGYQFLLAKNQVIHFEGVGKINFGITSSCRNEYNRISIDLDPHISEAEASENLQIIFAALGLGGVSSSSRTEDIERIKIMQLFRAFYPNKAYDFERDANALEESINSLKKRICDQEPEMEKKFQEYFVDHPERIYQQEVFPGQFVWAIQGLSDQVRKVGGYGLMAGINADDFNSAIERVLSLLKMGALSSQDRLDLGIIARGSSTGVDLAAGGGDSVFLRMLTNSMSKKLNKYPLAGQMQILCDLDLVERVGYGYLKDSYGGKDPNIYSNRSTIMKLTETLEAKPKEGKANEICVHGRIGPEFIKGIRVNNEDEKNKLIEALKKDNLVTQNALKKDCFNQIPLDDFIRVGEVKPEYWQ